MAVSAEHRRRFDLQVAALREEENDDEGTPEWRAMVIDRMNEARRRRGIPPLETEPELHRRARDLGLLR